MFIAKNYWTPCHLKDYIRKLEKVKLTVKYCSH